VIFSENRESLPINESWYILAGKIMINHFQGEKNSSDQQDWDQSGKNPVFFMVFFYLLDLGVDQQELKSLPTIYHGSLNVPIEHHPAIRYMVYNGYYKVMSNIPKMGQLPTPVYSQLIGMKTAKTWFTRKNHGGFRPPRGQAEQFGDQPDPPNCLGKPQKTW